MRSCRIAIVVCMSVLAFLGVAQARAQWTGGPVLIGGDDTDDHFDNGPSTPTGRIYLEDGFNFLGSLVTNGNTVAVCLGCDQGDALSHFVAAFNASNLRAMGWTLATLATPSSIQQFFQNTGTTNIQDAGIIYLPSAVEVLGGLEQDELDEINENRAILANFVKLDGGQGNVERLLDELVAWGVENLSNDQRVTVSEALLDPARTFVSPVVAAIVPEFSKALSP